MAIWLEPPLNCVGSTVVSVKPLVVVPVKLPRVALAVVRLRPELLTTVEPTGALVTRNRPSAIVPGEVVNVRSFTGSAV